MLPLRRPNIEQALGAIGSKTKYAEIGQVGRSQVEDEAWHFIGATGEPAYDPSFWGNASGWGPVGFRLTGGLLRFRGSAAPMSSFAPGVPLFTLPETHRPAFVTPLSAWGDWSGNQRVGIRLRVSSNGKVEIIGFTRTSGTLARLHLENVIFAPQGVI